MAPQALDEHCDSDIEGWTMAYLRRSQMLARLQANEIGRLFGGTPAGTGRPVVTGASGRNYTQVSSDQFLARVRG